MATGSGCPFRFYIYLPRHLKIAGDFLYRSSLHKDIAICDDALVMEPKATHDTFAMPDSSDSFNPFASRGGLKLAHALDVFKLNVAGSSVADLGCSTGGFTDCLLQRGAECVFAVDTAYGELAWKLRQDDRVVVLERTNAMHFDPRQPSGKSAKQIPDDFAGVDWVVVDLGWTKQTKALPAAVRWLKRNANDQPVGQIITLIKPHYESGRHQLADAEAEAIARQVIESLPAHGFDVLNWTASPIVGGKGGNLEFLALVQKTKRQN